MPPIRNDGLSPALWKIHDSIDVVVVLPWVPATTSTSFPLRNSSCKICGIEQNGMRVSGKCSSSKFQRDIALPTTTKSGRGLRFSGAKGWETAIPKDSRNPDIGG